MQCKECGAQVKDGEKICPSCGKSTETDVVKRVVGNSYLFTRRVMIRFSSTVGIVFCEEELSIQRFLRKEKRIPYQAIRQIQVGSTVNLSVLYIIIGLGIIGLACLMGGSDSMLMGLILLVIAAFNLPSLKNIVVKITDANGTLHKIKMTKNDANRDKFISDLEAVSSSKIS